MNSYPDGAQKQANARARRRFPFGPGGRFTFFTLLVVVLLPLIWKEWRRPPRGAPVPDGCISCHKDVTDSDPSHPIAAFGCATCHLGNAYSVDKTRAHFGMVQNPGDLRVVSSTCGRAECHGDLAGRVQNSIMATNRGIIGAIQQHWLDDSDKTPAAGVKARLGCPPLRLGVTDLMAEPGSCNLALDHYRKMCGGCHLWKPRWDRPGEVGLRGGGCSDCHVEESRRAVLKDVDVTFEHPRLTTRIPSENCVKCHNRSARIGLSYRGQFESEGYGTPHESGQLDGRTLSGGRFRLDLTPDIHFSRAGMLCIDCHTGIGVMGDGKSYELMAQQVDIACGDCHAPELREMGSGSDLGERLLALNRKVPAPEGRRIGWTRRGTPLYNLQADGEKLVFYRKADGAPTVMKPYAAGKAYHNLPGHERLACQACHSAWIPQCYGCHLQLNPRESQRDWLTGNQTPGSWLERRSFIRFSKPALGLVKERGAIYPVTPCQVFGLLDYWGTGGGTGYFRVLSLSGFDPHTTVPQGRSCTECHGDPKVLGLGEGVLYRENGHWDFRATLETGPDSLTAPLPLDGFTGLGRPSGPGYRGGTRPLNDEEMRRILSVNACLGCHRNYTDPIYNHFQGALERFKRDSRLPCRR